MHVECKSDERLCIAGLRYIAPAEHEVRVRLCQFAGSSVEDALPQLRLAGTSAHWWPSQICSGNVRLERRKGQTTELESVGAGYTIRGDDVAVLRVHVHERVVPDARPSVLYEDDDVLAVLKPAGIDIFKNPAGGAIRSSLVGMLEELGYMGVTPVHRIDRPVSGVVCLSKNKKANSRLTRCIQNKAIRKTYLARVCAARGPPPEGLCIDAPLVVDCENTTARVDPAGKPSETIVLKVLQLVSEDDTAVVAVQPLTGRMHQIRCHLAHAGYPIANDMKYCTSVPTGVVADLRPIYQDSESGQLHDMLKRCYREGCDSCAYFLRVVQGIEPAPQLAAGIWLHSWKYEFPTLKLLFEAPLPVWAAPKGLDCQRLHRSTAID